MLASDCLNLLRILLDDPVISGPRFQDPTLLSLIDEAQVQAVRDTSSPTSYQTFSTSIIIQLFGTPTTGENFGVSVGGHIVNTAEVTGNSLAQLATATAASVNASSPANTLAVATGVGSTVVVTGVGNPNNVPVSPISAVHVTATVGPQQEYQVYEQLQTNAVYAAGVLLVPSSIDIMEGWNTHIYDQNFQGSAPIPGSGAVPGTVGAGAPSWVNLQPQVIPQSNPIGSGPWYGHGIKPTVQPVQCPGVQGVFQPARYYWRDPGTIGLAPASANLVTVVIDGVCLPPPVGFAGQKLIVPQSYRMYLVRYAEWMARTSENTTNPGQQTLIENAYSAYMREQAVCRMKVRKAMGKIPRTFNHIPSRAGSRYHVRRNGCGGGGWL